MTNSEPLLILAIGITREYLSDRDAFLGSEVNIGRAEIDRLMGAGERYGHGILPHFLQVAAKAAQSDPRIRLFFSRCLRREDDPISVAEMKRFGEYGLRSSRGGEFVEPLRGAVAVGKNLETTSGSPTVDELREALRDWSGCEKGICLVVGSRTEIEVLQVASRLRRDLGFSRVLVCPHLTGSRDAHARLAALRGGLPDTLVTLVPDLPSFLRMVGMPTDDETLNSATCCRVEPPQLLDAMTPDLRETYRTIFSHLFPLDEKVTLRRLSGGYSGCGLFLSASEQEGARNAVSIVKVGHKALIERELLGYHQMKSRLGPHVPTVQFPVRHGALTGIMMEIASMAGNPETLQHCFETIRTQKDFQRFFHRLETALRLLRKNLYGNRLRRISIHPYFEFGLQSKQQELWLEGNIGAIVPDFDRSQPTITIAHGVEMENPLPRFKKLTRHSDRVPAGIALCHGDLNFANILFDDHDNLWVIDCSYTADRPVETDFAKLENDMTFVLVKEFTEADLPEMTRFLEYCTSQFSLAPIHELPDTFLFVATDARYERMYRSIRLIRESFLAVQHEGGELLYRIAQLKYAAHTLSFDQRRNRGECTVVQLKMALLAIGSLLDRLERHSFHQQRAKDRPDTYPDRVPVPLDHAAWSIPLPDYDPPVIESADVQAQDPRTNPSGKADPGDPHLVEDLHARTSLAGPLVFDGQGRPCNPRGRTGLQGRGFFWKWGPNLAVDPVVSRFHPRSGTLEFLLVKRRESRQWGIPGGMVRTGESAIDASRRSLEEKTGIKTTASDVREIIRGLMDDYRNTDHAWVETIAFHFHLPAGPGTVPRDCRPGEPIIDIAWMEITPELVRHLFANHAWLIRETLDQMMTIPAYLGERESIRAILGTL